MSDDAPQEKPSTWRRLTEPEMLIALAAMLIGLGALAASWSQIRIMREEQQASVWPRVYVGNQYAQGESAGFRLTNVGVGPAIVRDIQATVDGKPMLTWREVVPALTGEWYGSVSTSAASNRVVQAGETVSMFTARDSVGADAIFRNQARFRFSVCYCSIYETCWNVSSGFAEGRLPEPTPVERCPALGPASWME